MPVAIGFVRGDPTCSCLPSYDLPIVPDKAHLLGATCDQPQGGLISTPWGPGYPCFDQPSWNRAVPDPSGRNHEPSRTPSGRRMTKASNWILSACLCICIYVFLHMCVYVYTYNYIYIIYVHSIICYIRY